MTHSNLTDLLPDWHPLPSGGGLILKDERYAIVDGDGRSISIFTSESDWTATAAYSGSLLTEHPVIASRVITPLPTEEGATIMAATNHLPPNTLLTRQGGRWVSRFGVEWPADQICTWAPVTIGGTMMNRRVQ